MDDCCFQNCDSTENMFSFVNYKEANKNIKTEGGYGPLPNFTDQYLSMDTGGGAGQGMLSFNIVIYQYILMWGWGGLLWFGRGWG